jgi:hypothetical protein
VVSLYQEQKLFNYFNKLDGGGIDTEPELTPEENLLLKILEKS